MKKLSILVALLLLVGCGSSKETVETEYNNKNHNEIVKTLIGDPLDKDKTKEIFDKSGSVDVYYEKVNETDVTLTIVNNMDYYYTGTIDFEVCPFSVTTTALAPNGYASATIECPEFVEDDEFTYNGTLHERNEENAYNVSIESYYYEDNDELFDYVLDLEEVTLDDVKELAKYLYTESLMMNYESEMVVKVYPKAAYDVAFEASTEEAWNKLDEESMAGRIWLDVNSDFAEIYDVNGDLVERINYR